MFLHCASCYEWWAFPLLLNSASKQQSSLPAASRQYSLVMPSLAPDKTERHKHNLRPPDKVACNTGIFHKGERHKHSTFCVKLWKRFAITLFSSLYIYIVSRHLGSFACLWVHVFLFLILELPPCRCGKCTVLLKPACDYDDAYALGVHSVYVN